jgi:hypothetical protein
MLLRMRLPWLDQSNKYHAAVDSGHCAGTNRTAEDDQTTTFDKLEALKIFPSSVFDRLEHANCDKLDAATHYGNLLRSLHGRS